MARTVVGADRVRWRVGRRWLPFRIRLRRDDWGDFNPPDLGDLDLLDSPAGFAAAVGVLVTAILLFLVIWPLIAIAFEVVLLLVVLVVAVAGRVLFRRPWSVVASSQLSTPTREHTWSVVGWRRSGQLIDEVAHALEHGTQLPAHRTTIGPRPRAVPEPGDVSR